MRTPNAGNGMNQRFAIGVDRVGERQGTLHMNKWIRMVIGTVAVAGFMGHAVAQDKGTPAEAKAMAQQAADHVKKVGPDQAFKDFNDKANTTWQKKDLYVFAYNMKGDCLAHGANQALVGKNQIELKDPKGRAVVQELVAAATKGGGSVDYEWPNPKTQQVEAKTSFVAKLSGVDGFVGVGAYK
jgi:signal transduction histidine kinase